MTNSYTPTDIDSQVLEHAGRILDRIARARAAELLEAQRARHAIERAVRADNPNASGLEVMKLEQAALRVAGASGKESRARTAQRRIRRAAEVCHGIAAGCHGAEEWETLARGNFYARKK